MTNLKWEDIDLAEGTLKVVSGKGGKTARVNLSSTLVTELERVPLEKRTGYLLPSRSRIAVYKRLEAYRKRLTSDDPVRFDYQYESRGWLSVNLETQVPPGPR